MTANRLSTCRPHLGNLWCVWADYLFCASFSLWSSRFYCLLRHCFCCFLREIVMRHLTWEPGMALRGAATRTIIYRCLKLFSINSSQSLSPLKSSLAKWDWLESSHLPFNELSAFYQIILNISGHWNIRTSSFLLTTHMFSYQTKYKILVFEK